MTKSDQEALYWMGENIEDMSRERLLGVVREAAKIIDGVHNDHRRTLEAWSAFQQTRRASKSLVTAP